MTLRVPDLTNPVTPLRPAGPPHPAPKLGQDILGVGTTVRRDGHNWTINAINRDGTVHLTRPDQTRAVTTAVSLWDLVDELFDATLDQQALAAEQQHKQTVQALSSGPKVSWLDRTAPGTAAMLLNLITAQEREDLTVYAEHMREVLTGFRHGTQVLALPGEPREAYDQTTRRQRILAKVDELGTSLSTLKRHAAAFEQHGIAGLVRAELLHASAPIVRCDPVFLDAVMIELDDHVHAATVGQQVLYARVLRRVHAKHGQAGVDKCPRKTQAYTVLNLLGNPRGFFGGVSAKTRMSIANSPQGTYGALRATRPGEYVLLDTTVLDVFAMDRATNTWVRLELTVAIDLFSRSVIAMRLTPYTTKARDVAELLYDCARPKWARERWHDRSKWNYFGLPAHVVVDARELTNTDGLVIAGVPLIAPECLVIDHGKIYVSELVRSVCRRLGISIQPARPYTPTDKAVVERWFLTLRTGLLQCLKGYKGPDVFSRGKDAEAGAFYFVDELEEILWEWVATIHQTRPHKGLVLPDAPGQPLTPNEMYALGVERAGFVGVPYTPDLAFDFLPIEWREIAGDGLTISNLRYNGEALDDYRDMPGPRPHEHKDRWPFWVDRDDIRQVWFRVPSGPQQGMFREVPWVHRDQVTVPFSDDVALEAKRRIAAAKGRPEDMPSVLAEMLAGWETGQVTGRREHGLALRQARAAKIQRDGAKTAPKAVEVLFPADSKTTDGPAPAARKDRGRLAVVPDPEPVTGDADEDADLADDDTMTDGDTETDGDGDALASLW